MTTLLVVVDRELDVDRERLVAAIHSSVPSSGPSSVREGDEVSVVVVPAEQIRAAIDDTSAGAIIIMPAAEGELRLTSGSGRRAPIIRFDLGERRFDSDPELLHHSRALGLDGLPFVIGAALAAAESPAKRIPYGSDPEQYLDWREGGADAPVAVLLHGGFYRSRWQASLMEPLAVDLHRRGWTSVNLEYRRPDRHGWDATVADVHAGVAAIVERTGAAPIVLFGHSAGGQLALQIAEERADGGTSDALAVSLAGLVDLVATHDRFMGEGAVAVALGGSPGERPERYASASPLAFARRRAPWLLVQGAQDSADLVEMNRRLAASTRHSHPELIEAPGDHFSVIDPQSTIWAATIERVDELLPGRRTLGE